MLGKIILSEIPCNIWHFIFFLIFQSPIPLIKPKCFLIAPSNLIETAENKLITLKKADQNNPKLYIIEGLLKSAKEYSRDGSYNMAESYIEEVNKIILEQKTKLESIPKPTLAPTIKAQEDEVEWEKDKE